MSDATRLLAAFDAGDPQAAGQLLPPVDRAAEAAKVRAELLPSRGPPKPLGR